MKIKLFLFFIPALILFQSCYTVDENMFFDPVKLERLSKDIKFNDVYFTIEDSISINAWYLKKENSDAIILFLHGNSRNLYSYPWTNIINSLSHLNVDIFAIDYRGYGRSTGYPTFKGIYRDSQEALNYLKEHNPYSKPIIIYGLSLGSIPAVRTAVNAGVSGLILEGAISSTKDALNAAVSHFWLLHFVNIKYDKNLEFDSAKEIQDVKAPVMIIHGKNDNLPESMSLKLYDAAADNHKHFWQVENGNHCDTYKAEPNKYLSRLSDFINECIKLK